jgi:transcriptional regulator with XRE-family HTH domain
MMSRIENGETPYTQDVLEALAEALSTDPASLLMRDPTNPEAMWSIWDQAKTAQRQMIEEVARTILKTGSNR